MKESRHAQQPDLCFGARVPLAGRTDPREWRLPVHGPRVYFTSAHRMDLEGKIATTSASTL